MNNTKKKIFWGTGALAGIFILIGCAWQILVSNQVVANADTTTEIFTRANYSNSYLLVFLIPIIATGVLFYGIIRKK